VHGVQCEDPELPVLTRARGYPWVRSAAYDMTSRVIYADEVARQAYSEECTVPQRSAAPATGEWPL
jgi:hypothetical protein